VSRSGRTYYEVLGVPQNAGEQEIKSAYHRLARKYHPDKAPDGVDQAALEAEFALISSAYNVLKDKEKRAAYDQNLEVKRQKGSSTSIPAATSAPVGDQTASLRTASAELEKSRISIAKRAFLKGLQCQTAGDYAKAVEFFEVAIKNYDLDPGYHSKLAQTLLRTQRSFSRAIEAAKRASDLDPFNADHRVILAELYEAVGSKSMAVKAYAEILKWDPQHERAKLALEQLKPSKVSLLARFFKKK
jgi:curved DNA-binding protein CbpA